MTRASGGMAAAGLSALQEGRRERDASRRHDGATNPLAVTVLAIVSSPAIVSSSRTAGDPFLPRSRGDGKVGCAFPGEKRAPGDRRGGRISRRAALGRGRSPSPLLPEGTRYEG
jgi:hypothetical protein